MACTGRYRWAKWSPELAEAGRDETKGLCSMSFHSIYAHGFARVAACVTTSHVADPTANAAAVLAAAKDCHEQSVAVAVVPELCLSGYWIESLVKPDPVLGGVGPGLGAIVEASSALMTLL